MKNVWTIIKKEFSRFFKDKRMVITIFLPGILIYILYSVMGAIIAVPDAAPEGYKFKAYVNYYSEKVVLSEDVFEITTGISEEQAKQKVSDGELDVAIVFPENFDSDFENAEKTPDLKVYYNSQNSMSALCYNGVLKPMFSVQQAPAFTYNSAKDAVYDLSADSVNVLAMLVPMLMFALLASSCVSVAPEAIAGEKERGTMATMLITPIKRWQLALGKIASLTFFALLSGISSFIGVMLSMPKLMGGFGVADLAGYSVGSYFMLFGLIISIVLVIISAFSVISCFAKSVKEAGSMIGPLMIVIILMGLVSMFVSSSPSIGLFLIPLVGSGLAMSAIMAFTATPLAVALAIISNLVVAALLTLLLAFMFRSERIMFKK